MSEHVRVGASADAHRAGTAVVHRPGGVCASIRQRKSQRGHVHQGHEEDAQSRVVRAVVQPAVVHCSDGNLQTLEEEAARARHRVLDRDGAGIVQHWEL